MVGAFARIARIGGFEEIVWRRTRLDQIITLASPRVPWGPGPHDAIAVAKWALATSVTPYTEEVGLSVINVLLHTAAVDSLRPLIPAGIWTWLKERPSLPSRSLGWLGATNGDVVRHVRRLKDIEVLEGYLLHVWSEWNCIDSLEDDSVGGRSGLTEMQISIREDFSGVGMGYHRENLVNRLDHVLEELGRELGYLEKHKPDIDDGYVRTAKEQYEGLRKVLLEVDWEAMLARIARMSPRFILFCLLTPAGTCRIPLDLHVCSAAPVSIVSRFRTMTLLLLTTHPLQTPIPIFVVKHHYKFPDPVQDRFLDICTPSNLSLRTTDYQGLFVVLSSCSVPQFGAISVEPRQSVQ